MHNVFFLLVAHILLTLIPPTNYELFQIFLYIFEYNKKKNKSFTKL